MIGSVLIVGGGIGGMTAALALARQGVAVTLIDSDPNWRVYGAGITLTGLSLRAFGDLGVLEEIRSRGFVHGGMRPRLFSGESLGNPPPPAPSDSPPIMLGGGILRPVLHEILSARVRAARIAVRLGVNVDSLVQVVGGVAVTLSDGEEARYDLVVGADGIFSKLRETIFPEAPKPRFTGQGCWRVVAQRPVEMDRAEIYFGGPMKLGMSPISQQHMYVFVLEHVPHNPRFAPEAYLEHLAALMAPFGGHVPAVRAALNEDSQIVYRPLEWLLLSPPWYRGRVVLIGDAAHATTPHLASGAGLAVEDGLVLAEELTSNESVPRALESFMDRRFARARLVVETSVRAGELEMTGADRLQQASLMASATAALARPY